MKSIRQIGILVLPIIVFIGGVYLYYRSADNNYESFLIKENSKISNIDKKFSNIKDRPDKPDIAALQNYLMIVDPKLKYVPVERLEKNYTLLKQRKGIFEKNAEDISWESVPSNMGGRTRCLVFDPNDDDKQKVWAGSATGGLWFNNNIFDENSSWNPANNLWEILSISSIVFDPNNSNIMYVGTGEPETAVTTYRESSGRGNGIWKSIDAGDNWKQLESTKDFAYISDIEVKDESGQSVIYAAVVSGNYQGAFHQSSPTDGLYRSTDNGETWEQVLPDIPETSTPFAPSDIEIASDGKIFIGTMPNLNEQGGAQILMSTSGIPGSWTIFSDYVDSIRNQPFFDIPGRVKLASSQSNPNRIYGLIASGSTEYTIQTFKSYVCDYIIRSDDGGMNWTKMPIPILENRNWAYLAWHALAIEIDPSDFNTIIIGGLDLFKSDDGGNNWFNISDWTAYYNQDYDHYVHGDLHCIQFQPENYSNIAFSTDGGIFITENGNSTTPIFKERNRNFNTLQFYTGAINPNESSILYAGGMQDNGTILYSGTAFDNNNTVSGGDGAYCFINKNNSVISSVYNNRYYLTNRNDQVLNYIDAYSGTFISPVDYFENLDVLYANAHMFDDTYKDRILRIQNVSGNYRTSYHSLYTRTNVPFSAIKIKPESTASNTKLLIGTQAGRLFTVENAQSTPITTEITHSEFPAANISCIDISSDSETILVTFSNYGVNSVWISYDAGSNWHSIENNLPDIPVRWGLLHTYNPKQVMLATEIGVWVADDITVDDFEWNITDKGMANVRVDMLRMRSSDQVVLAATHGRGLYTALFESNIPIVPEEPEEETDNESNEIVFPNPTKGKLTISNFSSLIIEEIKIYNIEGKELGGIKNPSNELIDISLYGKGLRIIKIKTSNATLKTKVLVN